VNKKMLCILTFFIIVFSIILYFPMYVQSSTSLNYRSLQASFEEKQVRTITIAVPLKDVNSEFIEVRLQDCFFAESSGKKLNPDRLSIVTSSGNYHLKNRNIEIPVDELKKHENKPKVLLETKITVKPNDYPGKYHNKLIISQTDSDGKLSEKEISVQFNIEPWLELKLNPYFHKMSEADFREKHVKSTIPGKIKISGNIPWQLLVKGDKNGISFDSELILKASSEDDRIEFMNENINIRGQKIKLASSNLKASNTEKTFVITFDMLIKNFHQIKAGILEFPVSFELQPLEFN